MRRALILLSCCAILAGTKLCAEESGSATAELAAASERMRDSVRHLASDDLEGRGIGTEGLDEAAKYIAQRFEAMGLKTDWFEDNEAFQEFTITSKSELGDEDKNWLHFEWDEDGTKETTRLKLGEQFSPLALGKSGDVNGELVFVGYGITAEDLGYDDYADVDVEGKIVVMLRKEPQQDDPDSPFAGTRSSPHATFLKKVDNAVTHNAAGVIIVNDAAELQRARSTAQKKMDRALKRLMSACDDFESGEAPSESARRNYLRQVDRYASAARDAAKLLREEHFDRLPGLKDAGSRSRAEIPVWFVSRESVDALMEVSLGITLAEVESAIDGDLTPRSSAISGCEATGEVEIIVREDAVKNVVGVLEGDGPLADETIVIGAHYDHLGNGGPGSLARWTVDIHNGADDNASGTAALLEVAERICERPTPPRRRIVFIAFTAEERGLLGSKHYARNPRFALENTVAMINLDMVGRLTDNELTLYGTGTAKEFDPLVDRLNEHFEFDIKKKPTGYGPSDHASFYAKKVPVLFFFTGLHEDYHRPSDDWDKLNYDGMARISGMVVEAVSAIDEADARPAYVKTSRVGSILNRFRGRADKDETDERAGSRRPTNSRKQPDSDEKEIRENAFLGVAPSRVSGEGVVVGAVVPDGPAATAGVEAGDELLKFDGAALEDFEDLAKRIQKRKPGDDIEILIRRNGQQKKVTVQLGEAP